MALVSIRSTARDRILFLLLALVTACNPPPQTSCTNDRECASNQACVAHACRVRGSDATIDLAATSGDTAVDGPALDAISCGDAARLCGATCCDLASLCIATRTCCPRASLCGGTCCTAGQVCEGAVCHRDRGSMSVRCQAADGTENCCVAGEVCANHACYTPTISCRDFVDCSAGEYCESSLGRCLPQPGGPACQLTPSGGAVTPTVAWTWDGTGAALPGYNQVMMASMIANMNDDNGDGHVNENDVPDVLFITFCGTHDGSCGSGNYGSDGVLRAISGRDGHRVFDVTRADARVNPGGQVAIGDIDGDGLPEVVACASDPSGLGGLIAFENDSTFAWRSTDARIQCSMAAPAIADLDADGHPEVFVRYSVVHGADGTMAWHHDCVGSGGWATTSHSPCDYTTAADLDGDGRLELVDGNVACRSDGSVLWDRTADLLDGYPAVGDLDLDGHPEVIVVQSAFHPTPYAGDHSLRALHGNNGTDLWGPVDINQGHAPAADVTANTVGGGGTPTIANFDGDPEPEIALAGAYGYAVFEPDGTLKWFAGTHDYSSRKTGSSVFDFDGDGVAEAVYNDEYWLRVYDGPSGHVRYCECNTSATIWEYPVIADVNNDGHAELVLAENDYAISACPTGVDLDDCTMARIAAGQTAGGHGLRVFASPAHDWAGTRRIWNQHSYHVTNVSEAGSIPRNERANWQARGLDNFRQNVQPGATNIPDLVPAELGVDLGGCPDTMVLNVRVVNSGWAASPALVPVSIFVDRGGTFRQVDTAFTTRALLPGESELLHVPYSLGGRSADETLRFRVIINDPGATPLRSLTECHIDNNQADTSASCGIIG